MESLFGSLPEMLDFQRIFLQTLEERTTSSPDFRALETPEQLKVCYNMFPFLFVSSLDPGSREETRD